jgi:hypothetical protein
MAGRGRAQPTGKRGPAAVPTRRRPRALAAAGAGRANRPIPGTDTSPLAAPGHVPRPEHAHACQRQPPQTMRERERDGLPLQIQSLVTRRLLSALGPRGLCLRIRGSRLRRCKRRVGRLQLFNQPGQHLAPGGPVRCHPHPVLTVEWLPSPLLEVCPWCAAASVTENTQQCNGTHPGQAAGAQAREEGRRTRGGRPRRGTSNGSPARSMRCPGGGRGQRVLGAANARAWGVGGPGGGRRRTIMSRCFAPDRAPTQRGPRRRQQATAGQYFCNAGGPGSPGVWMEGFDESLEEGGVSRHLLGNASSAYHNLRGSKQRLRLRRRTCPHLRLESPFLTPSCPASVFRSRGACTLWS